MTPIKYQLRDCTAEDRAWAYALKSEAYRDVVERQFGPWNEDSQRTLFETRWNPSISSIVLVDHEPVGLISLEKRGDHVWLDEIQICRRWRARGLGTAIIQSLLAQTPVLKLQVLKKNTRARELYHRLAFMDTGETETHYVMERRTVTPSAEPGEQPVS